MQSIIVWLDFSRSRRETTGHRKAPAMPDSVAVIDSSPTAVVLIFSSVRANKMAVPDTVAIASERRNQAMRKMITSRSLTATLAVFHNDFHANPISRSQMRHRLFLAAPFEEARGGPGLSRSHRRETIVKENHQIPTRRSTNRRGRVPEIFGNDVFDSANSINILRICTKTAAQ